MAKTELACLCMEPFNFVLVLANNWNVERDLKQRYGE